jgi:hypothetical protein
MKKLMIVLLTVIALASCKKDALKDCKCGIITDDAIENADEIDFNHPLINHTFQFGRKVIK